MFYKNLKVFGPTDYDGDLPVGKVVYRSDYLGKLLGYLGTNKCKAVLTGFGIDAEARGSDEDHPFITTEGGIKRSWRYVAIEDTNLPVIGEVNSDVDND
jgi:hypothetical protein